MIASPHVVRAPGKAIVCGEYAVLDGAPAICVAVDRCVRARLGQGQRSPFVEAAIEHASRALGVSGANAIARLREGVEVDSRPLYEDDAKIGLGSSAAVTAAVVGLAFAEAGVSLADRARIFAVADAAHAEAQGVPGSGIDVATSVYGGMIRFQRSAGAPPIVVPLVWPSQLALTFVFSGQSASTANLVASVRRLRERDPARYAACMKMLSDIATAFAAAIAAGEVATSIGAAARWQPALAALGSAADAPIVTPFFESLAAIAQRHGAAAKPSGAGGGDLGVVLGPSNLTVPLHHALHLAGISALRLVGNGPAPGLSLENTP